MNRLGALVFAVAACASPPSSPYDAGNADAGTDAGSTDAGGAPFDAGCSSAPAITPPTPLHQNVCLPSEVAAVSSCAFDPGNPSSCMLAVSVACHDCLVTASTAPAHGPYVVSGGAADLNFAGCIADLEHDAGSTSCAARWECNADCKAQLLDGGFAAPCANGTDLLELAFNLGKLFCGP